MVHHLSPLRPSNTNSSGTPTPTNDRTNSRIPLALQNVFLRGSRGHDVHTPPPDASAMKIYTTTHSYHRNWWSIPRRLTKRSKAKQQKQKVETDDDDSGRIYSTTADPESIDFTDIPKLQRRVQRKKSLSKAVVVPSLSPQDYLDGMVHSRGYSNERYSALSTGYYNKPTPLQLVSYGVYVINLIHCNDTEGMKDVLDLGLSPNACNAFGESVVHMTCRLSNIAMLTVLLQFGCTIQVADDYGRTPLHDACWAPIPNFPLIDKLLDIDCNLLFISDIRGFLPLSYIRKDHWSEWLQFLQSKKDLYWPKGGTNRTTPDPIHCLPDSQPIGDPKISFLSVSRALMVAEGKLQPNVAKRLHDQQLVSNAKREKIHCLADMVDVDADVDDTSYSYISENDDDDTNVSLISIESETTISNQDAPENEELMSSWNLDEMNEILNHLSKDKRVPLAW